MNQATVNCHCPHCQQIDQVQKISAIYSAGLSTSHVTGHLSTGDSVQLKRQNQTYLSKKFKPPKKPEAEITTEGVLGCLGIILIFSAILAIYSIVINNSDLLVLTALILVHGVPVLTIYYIVWRMRNRHVVKPTLQERLSHWQELCNIWNGTYYCHRCHIVYHPDKPDKVYSVENASQLYNFKIGS